MRGDTWTAEREEQLIALAMTGRTPQEIAKELDRSVNAVIMRLEQVADDRSRWSRAVKLIKESKEV